MEPEELRRWVEGRRLAARREREEWKSQGPRPEIAVRQALALIALAGRLHGWPMPENPVSRREDAEARRSWVRLRAALRKDDR